MLRLIKTDLASTGKPHLRNRTPSWFLCTLGVSRNTVLKAYEALVADALLAARKGSGTHVSMPSDKIRSLATPMRTRYDLWAALREARFPATSASLRDPGGNPLYLHR
jgi:DNA-binding transcriptional MocR family regulator